ncbi:tetratricopeptide repeat protein [Noviherbaspirillum galbum]|uniref:Tetratricopeptide repeat protein n=1 Tax=Noviherbaspirillum galbum TaxID=2709383 RepID=A0A6B3SV16_9BURK|nr:tetratricopeptide repeat protein [Noviherbaspirillum galbum]NEX64338.1 tetratricopeptide repeat protein [Noviherbaspirillum galbum]
MKNALLIVTLPIVLSACANWPAQSALPAMNGSAVADAGDAAGTPAKPASRPAAKPASARASGTSSSGTAGSTADAKAEDALPAVDMTEDLMYKLLASEFAYQRGDWQTAYVTLITLSQQTRDPRLARRAAEIALAAKQPEESLRAVRLWRNLAPHSDEATQYLLSFLVIGDNVAEAKPILEQRLQEARPQTRALLAFQVQRLLARAKDKVAAFKLLEDVLAPYSDLAESHLALAQAALGKGDPERARAEVREALRIKPDSEIAALTMAQVATDKRDADRFLTDFLSRHPKARDVRMAHARMLVEQKEFTKARNEFANLLKDQPDDLTVLYALGVLSAQINDVPAAEKYLTTYLKTLQANPDEERDPSQALLLLAQLAEERKDTEAVLKWLAQIEPGEAYIGAQVKRAQVIAKRGDLAGARKLLQEVQVSGEREETQIILADAQLLRDNGKLQEAMAVLKEAVRLHPKNTDLLYDYAMVAEKANQLDIMEASLRKVMELAPDNQHAYNALGYSLAERNIRLDEARTLIEKALSLAPDDPYILDSMGWVHFRMGKLKEAESVLRQAYDLRPDPEIAVHLGEVLWSKGQKADAQKLWRDAQSKDPQNDTLKSTLARLNVSL